MPTLAERIQAALERHTAEVASILASASMAEVIAFTQSKGAVVSIFAAAPPEPAGPPSDSDPDGEVKVRSFVLGVLRLLQDCRGSASVASVLGLRPAGVTTREAARWLTAYEWKGEKVVRSFRNRYQKSFEITNSGRDMVAVYDHEHEPPTTAPKADTVSKVDERVLLKDLKAARDRCEKLHPWDEAFLSAYGQEIGLGLPGQEACGVAFHATEQEEGPRPGGIQYGALVDDIVDPVRSALEGIPDPGLSLGEVVRKTGRFINAIDMKKLRQDGVVSIKDIQGTDYYSLAPKAEERQEEGVVRQRLEKVMAWLKEHPWSSREEIFRGTGVTSRHISDLDSERPIHACREWKEKVEYSRKRGKSGQLVKTYALRGTDPARQKRGRKTNKLRDRLDEALAWLSLNPGSTLAQIADGIGLSYEEFRSVRHNRKANRLRWQERVEVAGIDKTSRGRPEELLRVKA